MRNEERDAKSQLIPLVYDELWRLAARTMLVQGGHHILSVRGQDSDLKRWGLKPAERGGKNAKKRAIVAVPRKLGIMLHVLWVMGEVYEPLRNSHAAEGRRRNLVEEGSRCQSPSPGYCEVAAERMADRKTDDSVRYEMVAPED